MAEKILIVIDMQNDFVYGCLGTQQAQDIVPKVVEKVQNFEGSVIFTRDTHHDNYLETQEGKFLPVKHCVEGSEGWQLIEPLEAFRKKCSCTVYDKPGFGSVKLAKDMKAKNEESGIESIELIGVCTDICVSSNALMLKAFMPEVPIYVDPACCAGVTPQKHEAALETMRSCQMITE